MRIRRFRPIALFAAAATLGGLALTSGLTSTAGAANAPRPDRARAGVDIHALVASMSTEDKIGQLFVTYAYGDSATTTDPTYTAQNQALYGVDNGAQLVAKYHLGGVIYFAWTDSLTSPTQTATLSNGLQSAAMAQDPAVPLLISTDQEGGNVTRIGALAAVPPGNMAIGATYSPVSAYRSAAVTGQQLRAMGINEDDAPVVDVNTNPANSADGPRSFGDNPLLVSAMAAGSVLGFGSAHTAETAKHFPGLGSTTVNTDNGVAVTDETRAQIEKYDLPPFRAAIAAGTDVIMAAHIIAPSLDPTNTPASLSKPIVTGVLRNELHYNGVVITDALSAAALESVPPAQRAVQAIEAGGDQALMPDSLPDAYNAVLDAVHSGAISGARLDQSVTRVLTLKKKLGLFDNPYTTTDAATNNVGTPKQLATMAGIAQHAITLVKNDDHVLPLAANSGKKVLVTGWGATGTPALASQVGAHGVTAQSLVTGTAPSAATIAKAVAAAQQNDIVVVTTDNAWGSTGQQDLVKALLATGKPVVVISQGGPYDIAHFTAAPTYLAAYGYQPNSLTAAVNTLFGANPTGRLPVTIHAADDSGTTLYRLGYGLHF